MPNKIFDYLRESLYRYPFLRKIASFCYYQGKIQYLVYYTNKFFDLFVRFNMKKIQKEIIAFTQNKKYLPKKESPIYVIGLSLTAGGAERQLVNTADGLRSRGYKQTEIIIGDFYKYEGSNFLGKEVLSKNIPITYMSKIYTKNKYFELEKKYPELLPFFKSLPHHLKYQILPFYDLFKNNKPAIVHSWLDGTNVVVGYAALLAGVPKIILSCRNVNPSNFGFYSPTMKQAYYVFKIFDSISFINNSDAGIKDYCQWLKLEQQRFKLIRNGVNLSKRFRIIDKNEIKKYKKSLGIPKAAPVMGTIIRFSPEKRPLLWIKTAAALAKKYPKMHFIMVGWGGMGNKIERTVKYYKLSKRFHILKQTHDISLLYQSMDVFLLTSKLEGTPNVALEAQWLGIPVVLTPGGGAEEAIMRHITGFTTPAFVGKIVATVEKVLNFKNNKNYDWYRIAKKMGPTFIEYRYGMDRMIDETIELYKS